MTQPLDTAAIQARHHLIADPAACGTCWRAALAGQPTKHPECARRAILLPPPDAPSDEDLADLTDDEKAALPARFHTPVWEGLAVPHSWVCAVCYGDGWTTAWPCKTALRHGESVFTPEHQAIRARDDMPALLAEVKLLATITGQQHAEIDRIRRERTEARARVAELEQQLARLTKDYTAEERLHAQTIAERDSALTMADRLAAALAPADVIGEHSDGNDPWQNALDYAAPSAAPGAR